MSCEKEEEKEIITQEESNEHNAPPPDNSIDQNVNDNLLIDFSDGLDDSEPTAPTNNHNALEELTKFNGDTRLGQDQDLLVMLSDDKPINNDFIENNPDTTVCAPSVRVF